MSEQENIETQVQEEDAAAAEESRELSTEELSAAVGGHPRVDEHAPEVGDGSDRWFDPNKG